MDETFLSGGESREMGDVSDVEVLCGITRRLALPQPMRRLASDARLQTFLILFLLRIIKSTTADLTPRGHDKVSVR